MRRSNGLMLVLLLTILNVCTLSWAATPPESSLYNVGNRSHGWAKQVGLQDAYLDTVQPILTSRCVACHGCYEAPCQLNLQSYEGLRRGYNAIPIFSSKRMDYTKPTRIFETTTLQKWRELGFLPVVSHADEISSSDKVSRASESLVHLFVSQSMENNKEGFPLEAAAKIQQDFNDTNKHACVATTAQMDEHFRGSNPWDVIPFKEFVTTNRYAGMPFALTRLPEAEAKALTSWIEAGAKGPSAEAQVALDAASNIAEIQSWEKWLNQPASQMRHVSRYIYEHVFSALIHFDENPGEYFELVRTKSLQDPLVRLVTELPSDSPGQGPVYYRFQKVTRAIAQKAQNVWRVNHTKLLHLHDQFIAKADWGTRPIPLPDYSTSNIFAYFAPIPALARAKFMQENSRLIVAGMVQGMVCIGSTATYAIADHFWAWFLNPDVDPSIQNPTLGLQSITDMNTNPEPFKPSGGALKVKLETDFLAAVDKLDLAKKSVAKKLVGDFIKLIEFLGFDTNADDGNDMLADLVIELHNRKLRTAETLGAIRHFLRTTEANQSYQQAFEHELRLQLEKKGQKALTLNNLWKGDGDPMSPDGNSPNSWLSITRHERSASVQFGPEGGLPQSIWIMSYSNFERLYYDLVEKYKAWGNLTHKMATWRHMSYVRLEGEDLALSVLPLDQRSSVRTWFTHGIGGIHNKNFFPLYSTADMYRTPPRRFELLKSHDLPPRPDGLPEELKGKTPIETVTKVVRELERRYSAVAKASLVNDAMVSPEQKAWEASLLEVQNRKKLEQQQPFARFMPNITYVKVESDKGEPWVYTLQADKGYASHTLMLLETPTREPKADTLAVYRGFVGAYPELFLEVPAKRRAGFAAEIAALASDEDVLALRRRYGVERNTEHLWQVFDWIHAVKARPFPGNDPVEQGIIDLSQYLF